MSLVQIVQQCLNIHQPCTVKGEIFVVKRFLCLNLLRSLFVGQARWLSLVALITHRKQIFASHFCGSSDMYPQKFASRENFLWLPYMRNTVYMYIRKIFSEEGFRFRDVAVNY